MIALINQRKNDLERVCQRRQVRSLDVFGSAADGSFVDESSDLDFLVQFKELPPAEHYESYFGLWEDLQSMFRRNVDLVESSAMKNPYFIREVKQTSQRIYETKS